MAGVPAVKLEHLVNGSWLDVTSRLLWSESGASVQMQRGVSDDGGALVGTGSFVLDNSDGALTPRHPSSPHYPHLTRYRPVRFSAFVDGAWRVRHYGYLDAEPVTFGNEPATDCRVTWSTIDMIGMAALKPLRSVAVEATAARGPLAYWPLTDPESAAAADQSGNSRPGLAAQQWKTGGEIAWSSGVVLPTDNVGGVVFTPASDAGVYLKSTDTIDLPTSWSLTVFPTPAAKDGYVVQVGTDSYSIGLWYDTSTKKFSAIETKLDSSGDPIDYVLSTTSGTWQGGVETIVVTPTTVKLGSSGTTGTRHNSDRMLGSLVSVGGAFAVESGRQRMYSGEVKHLALWSSLTQPGLSADTLTGPSDMLVMSTAVKRVLGWVGLTATTVSWGSDLPVVLPKTEGATALDLISNYARGSLSRIFCDGGSVVIAAFDYLPATVTAGAGLIGLGIEWASSPDDDITDVTMMWPDGSTYTASEPAGYRSGLDLPGVLDVASGRSVADWVVSTSDGDPAFPVAPFDLLTIPTADLPALALLSGASVLAIPGLPGQLPNATQKGLVGTLTETIGAAEWTLTVTIATDPRDRLMIVGDATRGVVGAGWLAAPLGPGSGANNVWKAGDPIDAAGLNAAPPAAVTIQTGSLTITPASANNPTSQAVTFPVPFASTPTVVTNPVTNLVGTQVTGWSATSITATGFLAWACRTNTTPVEINWVAVLEG